MIRDYLKTSVMEMGAVFTIMLFRTMLLITVVTTVGPTEDFIIAMNLVIIIEALAEFAAGLLFIGRDKPPVSSISQYQKAYISDYEFYMDQIVSGKRHTTNKVDRDTNSLTPEKEQELIERMRDCILEGGYLDMSMSDPSGEDEEALNYILTLLKNRENELRRKEQ